ncbi:axial regulator YABBY 4 [Amaranthus tricolor]|uniref:axial regulator YABBY 4 n=1 Tax=Amaranthus tricolor TaxID=29722 RepID=UPI00258AF240|nr:axial regulator YABBY 4 [Amaranthus tricolor]
MATLNHFFDSSQEQICYVQCSFCTTILLVSVPYSSMSMVVTVRCGHCTGLLSVNMLKASFVPFHLFSSLNQEHQMSNYRQQEEVDTLKANMDRHSTTLSMEPSSEEDNDDNDEEDDDEDDMIAVKHIVHKPPEKKRRAPSAYNRFIKEEIKRLKAMNPNMSHKDAFSTAAKNWAHYPSAQHDVDEGNGGHENKNVIYNNFEQDVEAFRSI